MVSPISRSKQFVAGRPARTAAVLLALALGCSACGERKKEASLRAAEVNGDEITVQQINQVLAQRNLRPEQADAAGRQVLERLIDQQLALQKANEHKLERDPKVAQQIEAARREVLARAYVEKVGDAAQKPTADEIAKYYEEKPALFSERRIYHLQELAIEARPDQVAMLRERMGASKGVGEFVEFLKSNDFRYSGNQIVRPAEQLPMASLDALAKMSDGQAFVVGAPNGVQVVVLAGSRRQPVTLEQARPAIEQFIVNERKRKLVEEDLRAMRKDAKIEYHGRFAEGVKPGTGAASAPALADSAPK